MPKLNHTWEKDKDFKTDAFSYEKLDCKRCGCTRYKNHYKGWFSETYSRSSMDFQYLPECIDWNDNTLD